MLGENCTFNHEEYGSGLKIIIAHCSRLIYINDYITQCNGQQNDRIGDSMDISYDCMIESRNKGGLRRISAHLVLRTCHYIQ